jgi:hypothetical protein
MPFKWRKTWPKTYALKATLFAAALEGITSCGGRGQRLV